MGVILGVFGAASVAGYTAFRMLRIPDPPTRSVHLRSGATVELVDYGTPAEAPPTWHLEYRTRIPIRDREKLADEVATLWVDMEPQAESSGYSKVAVIPTSFSRRVAFAGWKPVVFSHESTAFWFQKGADGWHRTSGWPRDRRIE